MTEAPSRDALRRWSKPALSFLAPLLLGVWLVNIVVVAVLTGYDFDGAVADGPFQLFNPLRRLLAGQIAGRDFQFFHGIGIPFLHYPLFRMLGGTLAASETSRQLVSPMATAAALLLGWRWVAGHWRPALVLTAISVAVLDLAPPQTLYAYNSLMAARTFTPLIACAALAWDTAAWRAGAAIGVSTAIAFLLGTEHGIALAAALIAGLAAELLVGRSRALRAKVVPAVLALVLTLTVVLLAMTHGNLRSVAAIARFNLVEMGEDQFWYFGADPVAYVTHWSQLFRSPMPFVLLAVKAVLIGWVLWLRRRGVEPRLLDGGLVLLVYGVVTMASLLGIYFSGVGSYLRNDAVFVIGAIYFASLRSKSPLWSVGVPAGAALFCLFDLVLNPFHRPLHPSVPNTVANVQQLHRELPDLPRLSSQWQRTLDLFHEEWPGKTPPRLWSTYSGLPEANWGILHPDTDYIIHALGLRRRQAYLDAFDRAHPDLVQTEIGAAFCFEGWLQSTTWPLYDRILRNYVPDKMTPHSIVWRLRHEGDDAVTFGPWLPLVRSGDNTFMLPPSADPMAVVRLHYETEVSGVWAPFAKRLTRFVVEIRHSRNEDRVPLNPRQEEAEFPIHYRAGETPEIHVDASGLFPGGKIRAVQAEVSSLKLGRAYEVFSETGMWAGDAPGAWKRSHQGTQ